MSRTRSNLQQTADRARACALLCVVVAPWACSEELENLPSSSLGTEEIRVNGRVTDEGTGTMTVEVSLREAMGAGHSGCPCVYLDDGDRLSLVLPASDTELPLPASFDESGIATYRATFSASPADSILLDFHHDGSVHRSEVVAPLPLEIAAPLAGAVVSLNSTVRIEYQTANQTGSRWKWLRGDCADGNPSVTGPDTDGPGWTSIYVEPEDDAPAPCEAELGMSWSIEGTVAPALLGSDSKWLASFRDTVPVQVVP